MLGMEHGHCDGYSGMDMNSLFYLTSGLCRNISELGSSNARS